MGAGSCARETTGARHSIAHANSVAIRARIVALPIFASSKWGRVAAPLPLFPFPGRSCRLRRVRSVFIPLSREILRPPPCRCNLPDEGRRIADGSWSELATPGFRQHPANPVVTEIARSVDRCVALLAKTQGWFVLYPEAITVHCKYGFEDGRPSGPGVPMIPSPARFAGFRSSLIVEMFYNRGTFPLCWRSCHPVGG